MVMWVCEASEVILKGLQWKSWRDDGQTDRQTRFQLVDSAHRQDGPSENLIFYEEFSELAETPPPSFRKIVREKTFFSALRQSCPSHH